MFVERVFFDGSYNYLIEKLNRIVLKLNIIFFLVFLFRKRNIWSFIVLYEKILENIENGEDSFEILIINDFIGIYLNIEDVNF